MSFPRYPMYKDSGVEWFDKVPEHWEVKAIKWLTPVQRGASPRPIDDPKYFDDAGEYAWVRISDVTACGTYLFETTQRLSDLGSSLSVKLQPGDLFLSIAGSVGKACITQIKACIHDGFVYFPGLRYYQKYMYYIFEGGEAYKGLGKLGTQLNLNTDTIGSIRIAVPSVEEANQIVYFLDTETARIDALVAKQEALIATLQEKRCALISHAVTKGLDPNVPMKDSGVPWLGRVPAHWAVRKIKHFAQIGNGSTPFRDNLAYWQNGTFPWLTSTVVNDETIGEPTEFVTELALKECHLPIVKPGSILVAITGQGKTRGMAALLNYTATINQHMAFIEPKANSIDIRFFRLVLSGFYEILRMISEGSGSTKGALTCEDLANFSVPIPDLNEQQEILAYVDAEVVQIDTLITKAEQFIALLREHRAALIAAAVTGQIDVRGYVAEDAPASIPAGGPA
ncbi:MAG: restriction endonuclease subunit S [Roseiflexaceae bacterium]